MAWELDYNCCRGPDPVGDKSGRGRRPEPSWGSWREHPSSRIAGKSLAFSYRGWSSILRQVGGRGRKISSEQEKLVQNGPVIKNPFIGGAEKLVQNLEKLVQSIDFSF